MTKFHSFSGMGSQLRKWMLGLRSKTEALLSSTRLICIACGAAYTKQRELALCDACMRGIPWIHHVKCSHCGRPEQCPDCSRRRDPNITQNRSAVSYSPQMKEWLAIYKYRGHEKLSELFGTMLLHAYHLHRFTDHVRSASVGNDYECVSYVPLSETRLAERGFNQAKQMAEELGRRTGLPVLPLLKRVRHTDKQSFKSRGDRLEDLQGVFQVNSDPLIHLLRHAGTASIRVYLVDDVYTTGSTLNECARTLLSSGASMKIYGICWAR